MIRVVDGRWVAFIVISAVWAASCASQADPTSIRSAEDHFRQGSQAFAAGDRAAALEHFDQALAGSLQPDMAAEALIKRAYCLADAGRFDEALADLDEAEQGAPRPSEVEAARKYVRTRQTGA